MSLVFDGLIILGALGSGRHVCGLCAGFIGVLRVYGRFSRGLIGRSNGIPHHNPIPGFSSLRIITLSLATRARDVSDRG